MLASLYRMTVHTHQCLMAALKHLFLLARHMVLMKPPQAPRPTSPTHSPRFNGQGLHHRASTGPRSGWPESSISWPVALAGGQGRGRPRDSFPDLLERHFLIVAEKMEIKFGVSCLIDT